jgi:UDP-N-acetyl-D-glucosamine dehydrogenase
MLVRKFNERHAVVCIVGLGYVGLPLALAAARTGFTVVGLDIDPAKVDRLNQGESYMQPVAAAEVAVYGRMGRLVASTDFSKAAEADAIILCLPTPLNRHRDPDLSFIVKAVESIVCHLRSGQLVVLESTTYPGTTSGIVKPLLESTGLKSEQDFLLAYSPEREDPGNSSFTTSTIAKVVGGDGPNALRTAQALYDQIVVRTVPVSSLDTAEAVKLTENIFRAVNIALVNELKIVYDAMNIDIWEVIEAAKTKPFGYMPFYPGPGLGGHCVPIDPFYLSWRAREFGVSTRFIELAGEINRDMPSRVVSRTIDFLNSRAARPLNGAKVLLIGVAYKKNVDDIRESPALRIGELLENHGTMVMFHDPFVPLLSPEEGPPSLRESVSLTEELVRSCDAVMICTDHDNIDYGKLVEWARLVVDTRNACAQRGLFGAHIVKA